MNARRKGHRNPVVLAAILVALSALPATPAQAATTGAASKAATPAQGVLSADLEGGPIALSRVGSLHCHDFDRPRIHCFSTQVALDAAVSTTLMTSSTNYVLVFDGAGFTGSSMYISGDYSVLAAIGWNDRISSFKGQNGEFGTFYTDWFYGGSTWSFCCNQQASSLGSFNDAISSVQRT